MVSGGRPLIDIGYKYNARKVLSFIVTENAGSTNTDIPYLSKYPDQFTNVAIRPVARPLVMSIFVSAVNEVVGKTGRGNPRAILPCRSLPSREGCCKAHLLHRQRKKRSGIWVHQSRCSPDKERLGVNDKKE